MLHYGSRLIDFDALRSGIAKCKTHLCGAGSKTEDEPTLRDSEDLIYNFRRLFDAVVQADTIVSVAGYMDVTDRL